MSATPMHRLVQRAAHRGGWGKRPLVLLDKQLIRNEIGLRRLCAWLKIADGRRRVGCGPVIPAVVQAQPAAEGR